MRRFAFVFTLVCSCIIIILTSCQPEVPPYNPQNPQSGDTTMKLLRKVVQIDYDNLDSFITTYAYNAANQVISTDESINSSFLGRTIITYNRNIIGQIISAKQTSFTNNVPNTDTFYLEYFYSSGSNPRLIRSQYHINQAQMLSDSASYTYNSNGQVDSIYHYEPIIYSNAIVTQQKVLRYSGEGDINFEKNYRYIVPPGQLQIIDSSTYTYDNRKPPILFSQNDSYIIETANFPYTKKHNMVKQEFAFGYSPGGSYAQTSTVIINYTYTNSGQPATAKYYNYENGSVTDSTLFKYTY